MLRSLSRYYHTLKFLKWRQIKYRLIYNLRTEHHINTGDVSVPARVEIKLADSITTNASWLGADTFEFLNIKHVFKNGVDWNYAEYGKLWTYNLTYFEFLSQPDLSKEAGLKLIHDFINQQSKVRDGLEPFPISLRIIFWVKFLAKHQIQDSKIDQSLYVQLLMLHKKPEYHLLGNHLLENGFALLFGAVFFNDEKILKQAQLILEEQLKEQILEDGAHFELSPMYHQIMLFRLLDSINLLKNNQQISPSGFLLFLTEKAGLMLGWMGQVTFENGDMPMVNDSINGIAPTANALEKYASELDIFPKVKSLKTSGYRKIKMSGYELLVDVGDIGPDYIPGHAHSDTFNFILYHQHQPLLVDTGISTYEKNRRRTEERSTLAHNTLMVNDLDQSEVWGGFRVARRAKVTQLEESAGKIMATHDGYHRINCEHRRTFIYDKQGLVIKDKLTGAHEGTAFFHFHPTVQPRLEGQKITGKFGAIDFQNADEVHLVTYLMATGFNKTAKAKKAVVRFKHDLHTTIKLI